MFRMQFISTVCSAVHWHLSFALGLSTLSPLPNSTMFCCHSLETCYFDGKQLLEREPPCCSEQAAALVM